MPSQKLKIATFNVNNLFQRPAVLQLEGFNATTRQVLDDIQRLTELLARSSYAGATGSEIKLLLEKYDQHFDKKTPNNRWFFVNQIRGKLYSVQKQPPAIKLQAGGRDEWFGWIELKIENVPPASIQNTARVVHAIRPDILCVVEAEDRLAMDRFNDDALRPLGFSFSRDLLVDGNDPRGIDVGLYSQFEIRSLRSHVHEPTASGKGRLFSRDCPEFEIVLPSGKPLWVLVNHFKSQGYGRKADNDKRRKAQADKVREYLGRFNLKTEWVVVAGDFNDAASNPPLHPLQHLLATPQLHDVLDATAFGNAPRWTYGHGKQQLDYLLVSAPLFKRLTAVGIERRGMYSSTHFGGLFPHFPEVTSEATQASDHAAVWAEFQI